MENGELRKDTGVVRRSTSEKITGTEGARRMGVLDQHKSKICQKTANTLC